MLAGTATVQVRRQGGFRHTTRGAGLTNGAPRSDRRIGRCAGGAWHHRPHRRLFAQYQALGPGLTLHMLYEYRSGVGVCSPFT